MAGISSASLQAALEELEPRLASATLTLAEELFAALAVLDSSAGLRRSLTDPARSDADKSALVRRLIGQQVSDEAVTVVSSLATSRWADSRDIGDALETIAATVAIAVAENKAGGQRTDGSDGAGTGRDALVRLERDLFEFNRVVADNHEVQRALASAQAEAEAKRTLALRLVPDAGAEAALLIGRAVSAPRGLKATALVERFAQLVAQRQQRWIAEVKVSRPLSDAQLDRLQAGLNSLYGRALKIDTVVDPALLGGLRVRVGAEVVDASVLTKLAELRRQLAG